MNHDDIPLPWKVIASTLGVAAFVGSLIAWGVGEWWQHTLRRNGL